MELKEIIMAIRELGAIAVLLLVLWRVDHHWLPVLVKLNETMIKVQTILSERWLGPAGPQGAAGPQGPTGPTGPRGEPR